MKNQKQHIGLLSEMTREKILLYRYRYEVNRVTGVGVVYSQGGRRVQEAMFRGYLFDRFKMLAVMSILFSVKLVHFWKSMRN